MFEQDEAGAISLSKAAPKESIAHFSTAATKLTTAQQKDVQAWAAQLLRAPAKKKPAKKKPAKQKPAKKQGARKRH